MRHISSSLTARRPGAPTPDPSPHGDDGSATPPSTLPAPMSVRDREDAGTLPAFLSATLPPLTESLATSLAGRMWWDLTASPMHELLNAQELLGTALTDAKLAMLPADARQITDGLQSIADMLQVSLPSERGLKLYLAILSEIPEPLFRQACKRVATSHRYARLPNPADFIDAVSEDMARARMHLTRLEATLKQLGRAVEKQRLLRIR